MEEVKDLLSKYGKPAAAVGSAGVVSLALVDQALQGDSQAIEMIQNNSELIDETAHRAVGVLGSLAVEYRYSKRRDKNIREGPEKYIAMITGAYIAGGAGQASQYLISGTPELLSATEAGTGGLVTTLFQIRADSNKTPSYSEEKPEN